MRPTKLLIDLDERFMVNINKALEIAASLEKKSIHRFGMLPDENYQQKLETLFAWLDQILDWGTCLETETIQELVARLISNHDPFFSDYEVFIEQAGTQSDQHELKSILSEIIGKEQADWKDVSLIYSRYQEDDSRFEAHLKWRRGEKMKRLGTQIDNFDTVTTEAEIYYQYLVYLRAGKWKKKVFEPKRHGEKGKVKPMDPSLDLPY